MTQAERRTRHEASIAAFWEEAGDSYAAELDAWIAANPPGAPWTTAANDNLIAANDNIAMQEAA